MPVRVLRGRTGLTVVGASVLGLAATVAFVVDAARLGAALAVLALVVLGVATLLAVTRVQWLQLTHQRAVRAYAGDVAELRDAVAALQRGVPGPAGRFRTPVARAGGPARAGALVVGRGAAASPVDRSRDELLAEILGDGVGGADGAWRPVVVGVMTPALRAALAEVADVRALRPWRVLAQVADVEPDYVLIEEAALRQGAWFGVEGTAALALGEELEDALAWCAEADVPVLGVLADGTGGAHTPALRAAYRLAFPADDDALRPHGIPEQPLLEAVRRHAEAGR